MVTIAVFNDATCRTEVLPMPEAVLQDMVQFIFFAKSWHEEVEHVHIKKRRWQGAIRAHVTKLRELEASAAARENADESWVETARAYRKKGMSWRAIADEVNVPMSTIRLRLQKGKAA